MKATLAALVLLVWTLPALAREPDVRAQFDPEVLKTIAAQAKADKVKAAIPIPRVALFNEKGQLFFTQVGNRPDLAAVLSREMRRAAPKPDAVTLRQLAEFWLPPKGVEVVKITPARFYLVEYWAAWCAPCKEMKRNVGKWLSNKPAPGILWISVDEDPESISCAEKKTSECPLSK